MSRWCFEIGLDYRADRTGHDYHVYIGFEPLRPLYEDDVALKKLREWVRLVIVDTFANGVWQGTNPHVDIYLDLDALLRARVHDLGGDESLFFVGGELVKDKGQGPYTKPLSHPQKIEGKLRDCERAHHVPKS